MKKMFVQSRRFLLVATLATCAGALTISACDDNNDANDALESGALTVSIAPTQVEVVAGTTATMDLTVTREGTFNGPIELKAGGEPENVSVGFSPSVLEPGATTATISISPTTDAISGTYTINIAATGSLVRTGQQQVSVTILPAPPAPPEARQQ